jgi:hypothetical protein
LQVDTNVPEKHAGCIFRSQMAAQEVERFREDLRKEARGDEPPALYTVYFTGALSSVLHQFVMKVRA